MIEPTSTTIRHEPEQHRFTMTIDGAAALLEYRVIDARTLAYHHTFVPSALRGGGIASRLAAYALQYALDQNLSVVPTCPFVARYIERHPRFQSVLAPRD